MLSDLEKHRLVATIFTRPAFAAMARTGDFRPTFKALLKSGIVQAAKGPQNTLSHIFENAWSYISKGYRNEYVYKNDLASRLIFGRHSPRTAGFQIELPIGRSIVDVAVANGTTTAYEIKTEFDTVRRLGTQTWDYLKAFDKVYVVSHPAHLDRFESVLDPRVGLIALSNSGSLRTVRVAESNKQNIDPSVIFRCLRQSEYLTAIKQIFGEEPNLPNGLIRGHCETMFSTVPAEIAHKVLCDVLRARTTDENTVKFVANLPSSLRALGYATPLSIRQRANVLTLLSTKVELSIAF